MTFGGTDQHDLSVKIYQAVKDICIDRNIYIHIVTGSGYSGYEKLQKILTEEQNITLTRATGIMSSIMEKIQLAISANGRTVYELAHMNIPAIVIAQHERENTHKFSCEENGFVPVGVYKQGKTENKVRNSLNLLLDDLTYRKTLFDRMCSYQFNNKQLVVDKILSTIE